MTSAKTHGVIDAQKQHYLLTQYHRPVVSSQPYKSMVQATFLQQAYGAAMAFSGMGADEFVEVGKDGIVIVEGTLREFFTIDVRTKRSVVSVADARRIKHLVPVETEATLREIESGIAETVRADFLGVLATSVGRGYQVGAVRRVFSDYQSPTYAYESTCNGCEGSGVRRCPTCEGDGSEPCAACGGSGTTTQLEKDHHLEYVACGSCIWGQVTCGTCGGDGRVTCRGCDGTGKVMSLLSTECSCDISYSTDNTFFDVLLEDSDADTIRKQCDVLSADAWPDGFVYRVAAPYLEIPVRNGGQYMAVIGKRPVVCYGGHVLSSKVAKVLSQAKSILPSRGFGAEDGKAVRALLKELALPSIKAFLRRVKTSGPGDGDLEEKFLHALSHELAAELINALGDLRARAIKSFAVPAAIVWASVTIAVAAYNRDTGLWPKTAGISFLAAGLLYGLLKFWLYWVGRGLLILTGNNKK